MCPEFFKNVTTLKQTNTVFSGMPEDIKVGTPDTKGFWYDEGDDRIIHYEDINSLVRGVSINVTELSVKDILGYGDEVFFTEVSMKYLQECGYGSDDFYHVIENLWNSHQITSDHAVFSNSSGGFFRIDLTPIQ